MRLLLLGIIYSSSYLGGSHAFVVTPTTPVGPTFVSTMVARRPMLPMGLSSLPRTKQLYSAASNGDGQGDANENPYQDPNYPDLEFVNYNDPEYFVDQGVGDEFFDPTATSRGDPSTEEQVEAMREERRMRNDEYQFETYYKEVLKEGKEYKGEWTVFTTSTFAEDTKNDAAPGAIPRIKKSSQPIKVISRGERIEIESNEPSTHRLQNQRLLHHERVFTDSEDGEKSPEQLKQEEFVMSLKYWPDELKAGDFRGHQGIMCVGNGYTVCTAVKLTENSDDDAPNEGPFSEYRSEVGIQFEELRLRVKLDYAVTEVERASMPLPPLRLRSFTVCRETLEMWPRASKYKSAIQALTDIVFFGPAGAMGGLYDPPPVGSEEQAGQYLLLDLEGGATLLLPFQLDQDPTIHPDSGWVTSLDWTPGKFRFQVDRKVNGGRGLLGLRTLELSEVQSADADMYRPRDGGADMRQ
jgi:hypothetical protein